MFTHKKELGLLDQNKRPMLHGCIQQARKKTTYKRRKSVNHGFFLPPYPPVHSFAMESMAIRNGFMIIYDDLSSGKRLHYYNSIIQLVGGFNPSEKYQSIGMIIPNTWKNKKCSKPPTRYIKSPCYSWETSTISTAPWLN